MVCKDESCFAAEDLKKLLTPDEDGDWSLDSARLAPLMEQLTGATLTEELSKAVQPIAAKAFFGVVQQAGHEGTAVSWQWAGWKCTEQTREQ